MLSRLAAIMLVALTTLPGVATAALVTGACVYVGDPSSPKDTRVSTTKECGPDMDKGTAALSAGQRGVFACVRESCLPLMLVVYYEGGDRGPDYGLLP